MILIDLPSVVIPEIIVLYNKAKMDLTDDLVRRVILTQMLSYKKKYGGTYGKLVICADGDRYWRRDDFPLYKKNRRKDRAKSDFPWEEFHLIYTRVREEIKELSFKFLEIERMEADDVIGILVKKFAGLEPIMIVSADKDLKQLHKLAKNIKQWSPITKKMVTAKDYSLIEHIMRGDGSDGIPNIFSDDDVFMHSHKRQKSCPTVLVEKAKHLAEPETIAPNAVVLDKYKRNRKLIDLDYIPEEYIKITMDAYHASTMERRPTSLLNYAIKHKLKHVIEKMG